MVICVGRSVQISGLFHVTVYKRTIIQLLRFAPCYSVLGQIRCDTCPTCVDCYVTDGQEDMTMKFESKVQLADYLEISRGTLYRRAERESIDLDNIATVGLSEEQLAQLRIEGNKNNVSGGTDDGAEQIAQLKRELAQLNVQNTALSEQLHETEQKYSELEQDYKAKVDKIVEYADRFAQLNDQQQRLTLDVQDKLHTIETTAKEVDKRGFWGRLFN